jgi:solute carrier family 35, member F5
MFYFVGFFFSSSWRELIFKPFSHNQPQSIFDVAINGLILCPLWFGAVLSYNSALSLTSVSSNTIISSTSSIFTFLLSFILGIDSFSTFRLTSVIIVISGVSLVTLSDTSVNGMDTILGPCFSLLGAFLYGVYTTFMKKRVPDESPSMVLLLYGLIDFSLKIERIRWIVQYYFNVAFIFRCSLHWS